MPPNSAKLTSPLRAYAAAKARTIGTFGVGTPKPKISVLKANPTPAMIDKIPIALSNVFIAQTILLTAPVWWAF